ncbi:FKBP-type peptidyl-prolyl cis-trans isomerase [Emcibacter sp.]|uniref:FKBP-type peptidyl-prolyl cis-trans isomerase n=1 Tax=Emcibacter sp. TaxID=1979954 RepID=UPI003B6339E0
MLAAIITGCSENDQSSEEQTTPQDVKEEKVSESKSFLEENKDKPGVIVTDSGLQYKVLLEGTGKSPAATDTVTVHYEGTLTDGTKFDSSYDRGTPLSFPLNQVIRGWTEGLQLMKEGGKYKFFIPSELAYGPRGAGGVIGPNEDLIFTVELIRVN